MCDSIQIHWNSDGDRVSDAGLMITDRKSMDHVLEAQAKWKFGCSSDNLVFNSSFVCLSSLPVPVIRLLFPHHSLSDSGKTKGNDIQETGELADITWVMELCWCALVLSVALWIGFSLGARNVLLDPKIEEPELKTKGITQVSTAAESPETQTLVGCHKGSFIEFELTSCPTPAVESVSEDTDDSPDSVPVHIENGRLISSFTDITEIRKDCWGTLSTAVHVLDGKQYLIKEVDLQVRSLCEVMRHQVFQEIQAKIKCSSKNVIRYITCWVEQAESRPSQVKVRVFVQIELFSLTSLADFLSRSSRRTLSDACLIFRQILKGVCSLHEDSLPYYDLSPASIYIDPHLNVKIGDFELARSRKMFRSCTASFYGSSEEESDCTHSRKKNMFALGLILFQLTTDDFSLLFDFIENRAFPEEFVTAFPQETELIAWMTKEKCGARPEAGELLESPMFQEWSMTAGILSPSLRPRIRNSIPIS